MGAGQAALWLEDRISFPRYLVKSIEKELTRLEMIVQGFFCDLV
jgi:hypothetical protein